MKPEMKPCLLAYYLPGFHEDKFNNEWWGKGFTEWDNVKAATPLFTGHKQPKIPARGCYDLSDSQVIQAQFDEARYYGIDGFVIYDYWYCGKRPLCGVLDNILEHQEIAGKFSICWANHSWTRSWKNRTGALDVLITQEYEDRKSRQKHYEHLAKVFSDPRYIKINGRPLFQIYLPDQVPDLQEFVEGLREFVAAKGIENPYISGIVNKWLPRWFFLDPLDSITLGNPTLAMFGPDNVFGKFPKTSQGSIWESLVRAAPDKIKKLIYPIQEILPQKPTYFDYCELLSRIESQSYAAMSSYSKPVFLSTFSGFDNTPRYKRRAKIVLNRNSDRFRRHLHMLAQLNHNSSREESENIIFINAWNEWGEGMHLEPCSVGSRQFLKQIKDFKGQADYTLS